jgi:hypothetical protein
MAKGSNLKGRWGNGVPRESVTRTGFLENTITSPKADAPPPEKAPLLLALSDPWYEVPSRVKSVREDPNYRSVR